MDDELYYIGFQEMLLKTCSPSLSRVSILRISRFPISDSRLSNIEYRLPAFLIT
jgi:hypothetical protein